MSVDDWRDAERLNRRKDDFLTPVPPSFTPYSRLPKLSIDVVAQTARHGLHTRSCTPERHGSKQSGYICSSICRWVTEHRLIVLEIYIYLRLNYPAVKPLDRRTPTPLADYVCKRLPALDPVLARKSVKTTHCARILVARWVTVTFIPADSP